jgi:hypothetical protein
MRIAQFAFGLPSPVAARSAGGRALDHGREDIHPKPLRAIADALADTNEGLSGSEIGHLMATCLEPLEALLLERIYQGTNNLQPTIRTATLPNEYSNQNDSTGWQHVSFGCDDDDSWTRICRGLHQRP